MREEEFRDRGTGRVYVRHARREVRGAGGGGGMTPPPLLSPSLPLARLPFLSSVDYYIVEVERIAIEKLREAKHPKPKTTPLCFLQNREGLTTTTGISIACY